MVKDVAFREVDRIGVRGRDEALTIYEPLGGELDAALHAELKLWSQTLRGYRARNWDQTDVDLVNLQRLRPDCGLYRLYAGRVSELRRATPAPRWRGVTAVAEKYPGPRGRLRVHGCTGRIGRP